MKIFNFNYNFSTDLAPSVILALWLLLAAKFSCLPMPSRAVNWKKRINFSLIVISSVVMTPKFCSTKSSKTDWLHWSCNVLSRLHGHSSSLLLPNSQESSTSICFCRKKSSFPKNSIFQCPNANVSYPIRTNDRNSWKSNNADARQKWSGSGSFRKSWEKNKRKNNAGKKHKDVQKRLSRNTCENKKK
jgi:hypothetical protein